MDNAKRNVNISRRPAVGCNRLPLATGTLELDFLFGCKLFSIKIPTSPDKLGLFSLNISPPSKPRVIKRIERDAQSQIARIIEETVA